MKARWGREMSVNSIWELRSLKTDSRIFNILLDEQIETRQAPPEGGKFRGATGCKLAPIKKAAVDLCHQRAPNHSQAWLDLDCPDGLLKLLASKP